MARTIGARSIRSWLIRSRTRRCISHRATMPKSGNVRIALARPGPGMRTHAAAVFGKSGGSDGNRKVAIVTARWRKPPCSGLPHGLVTITASLFRCIGHPSRVSLSCAQPHDTPRNAEELPGGRLIRARNRLGKGESVYFPSLCNNARSSYNRSDVAIPIKTIPFHLLPAKES
jgi:hypothetical protein